MNEKKRKFNLFKFIKGLFYFMCIITMFASLMRKVKAEDYSEDMWSMIEDDLSTYNSSNTLSQVQSVYLQSLRDRGQNVDLSIAKFVRFECSSSRGGSIDNVVYYFCQYESAMYSMPSAMDGNLTQYYLGAYDYSDSYAVSLDNIDTDKRFYILQIRSSNSVNFLNHRTQATVQKSPIYFVNTGYESDLSTFYMRNTYNSYDNFYGGGITAYGDITSDSIIARGDNYLVDSDCRVAFYTGQSISYASDNRFKIGTYKTAFGTSILGINLDDYITHYGQYESSYLSNLTLTLEYTQGLTVTQHTYSFSNQSDEYHYVNSSGKMALSIPYYTFDGYDPDTDTFPDYDNVKIVQADLSIGYTLQLNVTGVDDYYVSLNYSLYVGHSYDTNVPQVVTPQTIVFNQVIDGNDWSVSSGIVSQGSTPVIPSWSNNCRVLIDTTVTNTTADAPVGIIYNYYITYSDIENYRIFSYDDNVGDIEVEDYTNIATFFANYLLDKTPTFYDVIVIDFGTSNSSLWGTETEYVFYTNNYWLRQSIYGLSNLQYAVQSCGYYTSSLYDYMTTVMGTLNSNMVSYFTTSSSNQNTIIGKLSGIGLTLDGFNSSFESYSSSMVNYASSILNAINGLTFPTVPNPIDYSDTLETISGQIDDVIEAINNLEFDVGDIDLSVNWTDMTVALGGDLVYLFKPTYNDIDDRFEDYLDSIGILAVPFNFVSGIYDTMAEEGWSENLEITVPQIKVMGHILLERTDYSINPYIYFNYIGDDSDIRDDKINTGMFQMIIMYIAILGASWFTYCHIFRRESEINEE